jgi:hypothetical protein
MFPDFLENPQKYAEAESYWKRVWERVLAISTFEEPWESPWLNQSCADGNPIFSAWSPRTRRGVSIIQEAPGEPGDRDLDWWLDYFGDKDSPGAVQQLVIACCPSRQNTFRVERLLRQWFEEGQITQFFETPGTHLELALRGFASLIPAA